jgi:transposase-like protein
VSTTTNTPCIEWTKARDKNGYGRIQREGWAQRAHRWFWKQAHGPIPDGMVLLHACDNPPCVNLDHLRLGTVADNNADARAKGRTRSAPPEMTKRIGTDNGRAKLSAEDVQAVRLLVDRGAAKRAVARRFNINDRQVARIASREQWRHVPELDERAEAALIARHAWVNLAGQVGL